MIYVQTIPSSPLRPELLGVHGHRDATATRTCSGTLAGQLTIASQNDIIIKGNLVYHQYPSGTDVLGLIANNDVDIYHPVNGSGVEPSRLAHESDGRRRDPGARPLVLRAELERWARRSATSR